MEMDRIEHLGFEGMAFHRYNSRYWLIRVIRIGNHIFRMEEGYGTIKNYLGSEDMIGHERRCTAREYLALHRYLRMLTHKRMNPGQLADLASMQT